MDELHEAALAYYNNCSPEQRSLAWQFFQAMDVDRDGRVSLQEYSHFLCQTAGLAWVRPEMFLELDRNRDGQLDFWEVLTLYYVARTRTISCRQCRRSLNGLYFTCVTCFDTPCSDTFDLCLNCYRQRWYNHPHCLFVDSYVLLRSRRSHNPQLLGDQNLAGQEPSTGCLALAEEQPATAGIGWLAAYRAIELALLAGSLGTFCTIM